MAKRTCSIEGCERPHEARGYCHMHYVRLVYRPAERGEPGAEVQRHRTGCSVEGCDEPHLGLGLCRLHYSRKYNAEHPRSTAKTCSVEGCERSVLARDMCSTHYSRAYRAARRGGPTPIAFKRTRGVCSVPGCGDRHFGHGLCRVHHKRVARTGAVGQPDRIDRTPTWESDRRRFLRFCSGGIVRSEDGCIDWLGAVDDNGYGRSSVGARQDLAHRVVVVLFGSGQIPKGMHTDHLCRNRRCVNLFHLEVVTPRENTLRGVGPSAVNARKTHCLRGHEFTPENTYVPPSRPTHRYCRTCRAERAVRIRLGLGPLPA